MRFVKFATEAENDPAVRVVVAREVVFPKLADKLPVVFEEAVSTWKRLGGSWV